MQGDNPAETDPQAAATTANEGTVGDFAPDPDFPIEGGGGVIDDGGQVYTGPPPKN